MKMPMIDFTSALYLGFRHPSRFIRPWNCLTTGAPAAQFSPVENLSVARRLAELQGCETGTLAPSTLHLFWDLFSVLRTVPIEIYLDGGVYPIIRWGVERAAAQGVRVHEFCTHNVPELRHLLSVYGKSGKVPLIVADGFSPGSGKPTPLRDYLDAARACGGCLIVDDTQALGIFGRSPGTAAPYGKGGGGTLRLYGLSGPDVLVVSSLAKGFGVPLAVMAGSREAIRSFEADSLIRVHCSPPSTAVVHASMHALDLNERCGDVLRLRLARLVHSFREGLRRYGLSTTGELFPVQTLALDPGIDVISIYRNLINCGVRPVLHNGGNKKIPRISFIITATHTGDQIDTAVDAIVRVLCGMHLNKQGRCYP